MGRFKEEEAKKAAKLTAQRQELECQIAEKKAREAAENARLARQPVWPSVARVVPSVPWVRGALRRGCYPRLRVRSRCSFVHTRIFNNTMNTVLFGACFVFSPRRPQARTRTHPI